MESLLPQRIGAKNQVSHFASKDFEEFLIFCFHHFEIPQKQLLNCLQIGGGNLLLKELSSEYKMRQYILDKNPAAFEVDWSLEYDLDFFNLDILDLNLDKKFDIIVDNHCLHCICDKNERALALQKIYSHLRNGGIFISETMVSHGGMLFQEEFYYSDQLLYLKDKKQAIRSILESEQIEKELLNQGFHLKLFRGHEDLNFIIDFNRELAFHWDPQVLRFVCQK